MGRGAWDLPLTSDNQHYFFIAQRAAEGIAPHVSQFDPKHELSGLLSAAAIRVGYVAGIGDVHAVRILSLALTAASVAMAGWAAWLLGGGLAAHLASLFMLGSSGFLYMGSMGCRPKVFLVFFALATLVAVARRRHMAAGALSACAFLCWQPGLVLFPLAAAALWPAARGRDRLRFFAAAAVPAVLYHGYFLTNGALSAMIEQAYILPARYSEYTAPLPARSLAWFARAIAAPMGGRVPGELLLGSSAAAWLLIAWTPRKAVAALLRRPGLLFCFAATNLTFAFTLLEHQGYPDVFFCLPFMAVLSAVVIAESTAFLLRRVAPGRHLSALLTAAVIAAAVSAPGPRAWTRFPRQFSLDDQYRLGAEVGTLISYGYTVYAVGCTHLLALNRIGNYVPYGYFFRRINRYVMDEARRATGQLVYRPLVDGRMPDVILLSRWFVPGGYSWLRSEYKEVTTEAFREQGVSVWVR